MATTLSKQLIVQFKDNRYSAELLNLQSGSGPMIEIDSEELHENFITIVSLSNQSSEEMQKRVPVFAKYEGKYVVLLGLSTVMESCRESGNNSSVKLKGRLLSNPMLKRCII